MFSSKYLSAAFVASYDAIDDANVAAAQAAQAAQAAAQAAAERQAAAEKAAQAAAAAAQAKFTQDDVNRIMAEDKRKHQAQLKQMEDQLNATLQSKNLTEESRVALQSNLEMVQGQLRTKEQQLAEEKKQIEASYSQRLADTEKKATLFESLYRDSTIDRSLQDAAIKNEACSASQIITLVRPMTKMVDVLDPYTQKPSGKLTPMVEMLGKNPTTGEQETQTMTPDEAVKRMKEMPDVWGNLFKANVVSGIGSNSATGGHTPGQNGRIDVRKLTPQQYREIRKNNPELLGLAPNRK